MRNLFAPSLLGTFVVCSLLISCDNNTGKQFSNKQDSLSFAQAVMEKYPGEEMASVLQDTTAPSGPVKGRSFQTVGVEPIDWETVLLYQSNYDKDPQLKSPKGDYYKGFSIDTSGYQEIIKTAEIKSLYLRLGKKPDGSYTIMLLGMDANGKIITHSQPASKTEGAPGNDPTNFDSVDPCPNNCPEEDPGS